MQPGDVIAFGGKGHFSEIIKFATLSNVSHVGVILQTQVLDDNSDRFFNQIIESTGCHGVGVSKFSDRLKDYVGELWWLPLAPQIRQQSFDSLPLDRQGLSYNHEDFNRFFCSELVATGLEKAGAVDSINASEVTPIELCRWNIYADNYYQLKGESSKRISRFNTASPLLV